MTTTPFRAATGLAALTVFVFLLQLVLPAILLWLRGAPDPYEGRNFTAAPAPSTLIGDDSEPREQMASAFKDRLVVRKLAIATKNRINAVLFDTIDTPQVVSGRDGMLYLKRSLTPFECDQADDIEARLRRYELLMALAAESGRDILVTQSPNKASVTPDALGGRVMRYAECYERLSRYARQEMAARGHGIFLDHQPSIEALGARTGETYFKTDTHWKGHVPIAVLKDIYGHFTTVDTNSFDTVEFVPSVQNKTDLASNLGWAGGESTLVFKPEDRERLFDTVGPIPARTRMLHDSFYGGMQNHWPEVFEDLDREHYGSLSATKNAQAPATMDHIDRLANADRILVNGTERALLGQLSFAALSIDRALGYHLVEANKARADRLCAASDVESIPVSVGLRGYAEQPDGRHLQTAYPFIEIDTDAAISDRPVCLSLIIDMPNPRTARLSAPAREDAITKDARFTLAPFAPDGDGTLSVNLLLPPGYTEGRFLLEPTGEVGDRINIRTIRLSYARDEATPNVTEAVSE